MHNNKLIQESVGADLSALGGFLAILINLLICTIAPILHFSKEK